MELFYIAVFGVVAAAAAALELTKTKGSAAENTSREFMRFRNNYVVVYALMMGCAPPGSAGRPGLLQDAGPRWQSCTGWCLPV